MLTSKNLEDKTYQEMLTEAIMQIPLYSSEWTNFNPSDPGITILENLTAFEALQENSINQITPVIKQKLLKMAGFEGKKGKCARVLLAPISLTTPVTLQNNQRFFLGDMCYETNRSIYLDNCHITGVYGKRSGNFYDYSFLKEKELPVPAMVFGENPKAGDSVYFVADQLPSKGEEIIFYLTVADRFNRNSFENKDRNTFATLKWECYTVNGYEQMNVRDYTGSFLISGEIRMRIPDSEPAILEELDTPGYVIRATLEYADYDVRPKIAAIDGFLFEVWQKDTKSSCNTYNKVSRVEMQNDMAGEGYILVFCKEEKGSSYHKYEPLPDKGAKGRYYEMEREERGSYTFCFDKRKYKYGPEKLKNAIKILTYSESMMRQYAIGVVLGADNQSLDLPVQNIVTETFCIIAKRMNKDGEEIFDFVRPNRYEEGDLSYYLLENDGKIIIEDAGDFIGAQLFIGSCSVTRGKEGNIREQNHFKASGLDIDFINPGPGTGGCFRESIQEVKARFLADIQKPYTAVTATDYENIIKETPELCIHKVKAFLNETSNSVRIAVKPGTDEEFPKLSETYRKALQKQIENKRLLTTKVEIVSPAYLGVNVSGVIYVKRHYEGKTDQIVQRIKEKLDYLHSEKNFGERLKFDEVFRAVENMECVEYIYELSMFPASPELGCLQENDIVPNENCLCYASQVHLEIRNIEG